MKKEEKKKTAAAGAAAAVVAAAGVAVAGMFGSPAEILEDDGKNAACIDRADAAEAAPATEEDEPEENEEEKKRPGLKAAVSRKLMSLPVAARALVLVPLWAIGSSILLFLGGLWQLVSPALGKVLGAVALAAVIYGVIALGIKALFPNVPLKKLLNRKTVPAICIAGAFAALLDVILPLFISDYQNIRSVVQTVLMTAASGAAVVSFSLIFSRRKKTEEARESEPEPEPEPEIPDEITLEDAGGVFKIKTGK